MNKNNNGMGGSRHNPDHAGGRPRSDANYGPKKKTGHKPQNAGRGDRGSRGGGGSRGGDRQQTEMFKAVCGKCDKPCQVPFKPVSSKPVLCSECFGKSKPEDRGGFEKKGRFGSDRPRRDFDAPRRETAPGPDYKKLLDQVSILDGKVSEILKILQKDPTAEADKD